ncbi:uncharacterized protein LOC110851472 [Folsomia candida]|uniref:Uncharacterized protein n=1 Tax=Folsomia candida TaxID=158441 RepID=A0A226E5T0_FOLCA|nr:uncharacterized protein LOC110851472 [Folsomia candida]XP_035708531.1 uncharacterized protein LOC110851472 [Folsomia candida]OXA53022.1 hypothetical protein Fcan01_12287 [Folsomia candida]
MFTYCPPHDSVVFGRQHSFQGYLPYPYVPNFGDDPAKIPGVYATATKNAAAASFAKAARIRLPKLLRLGARDFPKIYANLSLNCVDFLFGAFAGLYIGFQNGYIQKGRILKINRHIFFHNDSIEVGGKPADWVRWLLGEWYDAIDIGYTAFAYAIAGGCTQALMCTLYRSFFSADGSLIPMMGTYFIFSAGDNNFYGNFQTFANLLYITCSYEAFMMVVYKGNSTYWIRHFLERYVLRPFKYGMWPINWALWRPFPPPSNLS